MALTAALGLLGFWKPIRQLINDLLNSFKTDKGGFSARKCSAFFATITAAYLSDKHGSTDTVNTLVTLWLLYALLNSGLVTFGELLKLKNGNTTTVEENVTSTLTIKKEEQV